MRLLNLIKATHGEMITEAAIHRYIQMIEPIKSVLYPEKYDDAVKNLIPEIMNLYQREDRIVWALRYLVIYLLNDVLHSLSQKMNAPDISDNQKAKYQDNIANLNKMIEKRAQKLANKRENGGTASQVKSDAIYFMQPNFSTTMKHYFDTPISNIQQFQFDFQSPSQIEHYFSRIEDEWKQRRKQEIDMADDDGAEKVVEFPDGAAWFNLNRSGCSKEADAMGHCGNGFGAENETVLSLRFPVREDSKNGSQMWRPVLTFILNTKTGYLGEMKGRGNQKPAERYHPYIIELLKQDFITGVAGGGYLPENNFALSDLPEETQDALVEEKPSLGTFEYRLKKEGPTEDLIKNMIDFDQSIFNGGYRSEEKIFVLDYLEERSDIAEYVGDGNPSKEFWVDLMSGDGFDRFSGDGYVEDDDIEDLIDSLGNEAIYAIKRYICDEYKEAVLEKVGYEYEEYEDGNLDSVNFSTMAPGDLPDTSDIIKVAYEENDSLYDEAKWAHEDGRILGAESEAYDYFTSWMNDPISDSQYAQNSFKIKFFDLKNPEKRKKTFYKKQDGGGHKYVSEERNCYYALGCDIENAAKLLDVSRADEDLYEGNWKEAVEWTNPGEPYYGFSGYDEEAAKERLLNYELPIDEWIKKYPYPNKE